jgi:hypothetical protein
VADEASGSRGDRQYGQPQFRVQHPLHAGGGSLMSTETNVHQRFIRASAVALLLVSVSRANVVAAPVVTLTPARVDFGQVPLIGGGVWGFTVNNVGPGDLVITKVEIAGANAAEFSVSYVSRQGTAIKPGDHCYISFKFKPTGSGDKNAAVVITDNALDSPQTVPITATVPPDLKPESIDVRNYGGPIIQHPQVETIYLGAFWQQPDARKVADHCDAFLRGVVGSAFMRGLAEYGVGAGSFIRSATLPAIEPLPQITDAQLVTELSIAISDGSLHWPAPQIVSWPNSQTLFFLFTPPGVVVRTTSGDSLKDFLAYHYYSKGQNLTYAVIPWPAGRSVSFTAPSPPDIPFADTAALMMTPAISHELVEACTDSHLDGWWDAANLQEVADIPVNLAEAGRAWWGDVYQWLPDPAGSQFLVQKYWSQSARSILSVGN